jgi:hypothetical protein
VRTLVDCNSWFGRAARISQSRHAPSKNISKKGPANCRSLGCARDDKGEGDASMESGCAEASVHRFEIRLRDKKKGAEVIEGSDAMPIPAMHA